ncbi:hypothetical protein PR003_g15083 [Phytophthora rubi]|uniref:Secreted protein n=1 Tax=Phytophthora rubi TaxID=129364 RepID=A0A6A4EXG0_9STRA|nr:hypothetical protein PR001_g13448 [Phytophthora rubi]KAE9035954.1 hypothetical protein PR002_g7310 [Phytophthora rubi]KAE9331278.1 hypothetical protein PR003_g15083 [Phytophthora rubi]
MRLATCVFLIVLVVETEVRYGPNFRPVASHCARMFRHSLAAATEHRCAWLDLQCRTVVSWATRSPLCDSKITSTDTAPGSSGPTCVPKLSRRMTLAAFTQ